MPLSNRTRRFRPVLHAALVLLLVGAATLLLPLSASAGDAPDGDPTEVRTFQLHHVNGKEIVTILRSIAHVKSLALDEGSQLLTLRDDPETLELAARLVERHDRRPSLVTVDVEVFLVPRDAFAGFEAEGGPSFRQLPGLVRLGRAELGLVGRRPGEMRLFGLRQGDVELKDLKLRLQARRGESETADLVLRLGIDAETHHAQHGPSLLDTTTRRAVDDGGEIALELPVGSAQDDAVLVTLLTPRVVH